MDAAGVAITPAIPDFIFSVTVLANQTVIHACTHRKRGSGQTFSDTRVAQSADVVTIAGINH